MSKPEWLRRTLAAAASEPRNSRIKDFRAIRMNIVADDADGYSEMSTRNLPPSITAYELAQLLDLTIRAPNYVIRREFTAVQQYFHPVVDVEDNSDV